MTRSNRVLSGVGLGILVLLLLATAYNGLVEGINATHYADTPGMRAATAAQLLYGAAALAALIALVARRSWVFPLLVLWAIGGTALSALAPVVYGQQPARIGVLAGAAAALLFGLVLWLWRLASRHNPPKDG